MKYNASYAIAAAEAVRRLYTNASGNIVVTLEGNTADGFTIDA